MPGKARLKPTVELARLRTEQRNAASSALDTMSALEIARLMNAEDAKVAAAVRRSLPEVAQAIDAVADALRNGGRLIYVGTGTSGRIGALDAAEIPPTFNLAPDAVQFVIAGGEKALGRDVEADEDSPVLGRRNMAKKHPGERDVVVGIAASGRTPFTLAALQYAGGHGARTVAITCNPDTALERAADIAITVDVGPEVLTGSTRLKAGTAQKLIVNTISTGAMARLGYAYGNLMVTVVPKNKKLVARAAAILEQATGVGSATAMRVLKAAGNNVPVALIMLKAGVRKAEARNRLKAANGNVRKAVEYSNL